jgi:very-long-chain (3R)-3-hydroxyacyl-CoA dehydratase
MKSQPPVRATVKAPAVRFYLLAYNTFSALGWTYVLFLAFSHLLNPSATSPEANSPSKIDILPAYLPPFLQLILQRSYTTYANVGSTTAAVQSFAILEVLHVLLGWVRSPLGTTTMQISSRLFLVWGISARFGQTHSNPLYASMVLAWSATEVIRYSFYACSLVGYEPRFLTYLRYTTFYLLYPLGASSEAFLIYATLPNWGDWGEWGAEAIARAVLFSIWWPGLYIMYTYMISQRRKVLGVKSPGKANKVKST